VSLAVSWCPSAGVRPGEEIRRISPRPFLQSSASVARRFCHEVTRL
jgi:hypothetical protein